MRIRRNDVKRDATALIVAMTFPTLLVWVYFVALAPDGARSSPAQQIAYPLGKVLQFAFPLLYLWLTEKRLPTLTLPKRSGLGLGLGFGLLTALGMVGLYAILSHNTDVFSNTATQLTKKLTELGLNDRARYLAFGAFLAILHSLLEEYYWRWFVFGWLRRHVSFSLAVILSSLAFASHHVIVLWTYFPDHFWSAVILFSFGVAIGGVVWAWLYERTQSLIAPWVSHVIADAAIIAVGYDLLWPLAA